MGWNLSCVVFTYSWAIDNIQVVWSGRGSFKIRLLRARSTEKSAMETNWHYLALDWGQLDGYKFGCSFPLDGTWESHRLQWQLYPCPCFEDTLLYFWGHLWCEIINPKFLKGSLLQKKDNLAHLQGWRHGDPRKCGELKKKYLPLQYLYG